ncbi:hypothetical protein EDD21DRAFT_401290 [Dissophora ornata]|nr:hypothetical protein BGZ58_007263 [Dissophora ornata]KAI8605375.1 hypothetical protein EDD21DRAFT_401290 [Dissophora ornata]
MEPPKSIVGGILIKMQSFGQGLVSSTGSSSVQEDSSSTSTGTGTTGNGIASRIDLEDINPRPTHGVIGGVQPENRPTTIHFSDQNAGTMTEIKAFTVSETEEHIATLSFIEDSACVTVLSLEGTDNQYVTSACFSMPLLLEVPRRYPNLGLALSASGKKVVLFRAPPVEDLDKPAMEPSKSINPPLPPLQVGLVRNHPELLVHFRDNNSRREYLISPNFEASAQDHLQAPKSWMLVHIPAMDIPSTYARSLPCKKNEASVRIRLTSVQKRVERNSTGLS